MVTLFSDLKENDLNDQNVVKIWTGSNGLVEDFSREGNKLDIARAKKHLGIYGYKAGFLRSFVSWQQTHNEIERNLEQMRAMDNGEMIFVTESVGKFHLGVDTEIDLKRAIEIARQIK
jgi:CMP-2-keto-3-deoxyoctulosonic acid synthetase